MIAAIRLPEVGNFMTLNIVDIEFFKRRNKVRNYLHFDQKISNKKLFEYVTDKECKHPANTALPSDPISLNLVPT